MEALEEQLRADSAGANIDIEDAEPVMEDYYLFKTIHDDDDDVDEEEEGWSDEDDEEDDEEEDDEEEDDDHEDVDGGDEEPVAEGTDPETLASIRQFSCGCSRDCSKTFPTEILVELKLANAEKTSGKFI